MLLRRCYPIVDFGVKSIGMISYQLPSSPISDCYHSHGRLTVDPDDRVAMTLLWPSWDDNRLLRSRVRFRMRVCDISKFVIRVEDMGGVTTPEH